MSTTFAYIRVSTKEQNEDRQVNEVLTYGIDPKNIVIEKQSGKNFNRNKYNCLCKKLKSGDTLLIHSIDRLGRNYDEIIEEWNKLTKKKQVIVKILDTPILNTDNLPKTLIDKYIRDITLISLAFNAEQELHNNKSRQAGGIKAAKEKGKHLGRPKEVRKLTKKEIGIFTAWKRKELTPQQCMEVLNMKKSIFYNIAKTIDWEK